MYTSVYERTNSAGQGKGTPIDYSKNKYSLTGQVNKASTTRTISIDTQR